MWGGVPQQPQVNQYQQNVAPPMPGAVRPKLEPIDWNLVAVLDADLIRRTKDYDSLQKLVRIFVTAKLYPGSSRILAHPLTMRLCQLLQVAFEYLNFCQNELSSMNGKLEAENLQYQEKVKKMEAKLKKAEKIIKVKSQPYDKCPICEKKFKNLSYVDRHIMNRHNELAGAWDVIRGRKSPESEDNVQKILDKIDHLKDTLKKGDMNMMRKETEQELLETRQKLIDAEKQREELQMKENEEIRKQLFEAADEFNSSMILYNKKKRPSKMANKVKPAIVNLFDPNAVPSEIDPPKVNEPSPFNIQDKVNNFFNNPVNDFVRPQMGPSNDLEDGPVWNKQTIGNPFQTKPQPQFQLSKPNNQDYLTIPPTNQSSPNGKDQIKPLIQLQLPTQNQVQQPNLNNLNNNYSILNDESINNLIENVNNMNNEESIEKLSPQENIQIKQPELSNANQPTSEQIIKNANNFIAASQKRSPKKINNADIENVVAIIGQKVQDEMQKLGNNKISSVKEKYINMDPNYENIRKEIQKKLEMEVPMDANYNKPVEKTPKVTPKKEIIGKKNEDQIEMIERRKVKKRRKRKSHQIPEYSSPEKEKLVMSQLGSKSILTSEFDFQPFKPKLNLLEKSLNASEQVSTQSEFTFDEIPQSKKKKKDEDDWSYMESQEKDETDANSIRGVEYDNQEYEYYSEDETKEPPKSLPSSKCQSPKDEEDASCSESHGSKTPKLKWKLKELSSSSESSPQPRKVNKSNQKQSNKSFGTIETESNNISTPFSLRNKIEDSSDQSSESSPINMKSTLQSQIDSTQNNDIEDLSSIEMIPQSKTFSENSEQDEEKSTSSTQEEFNFPPVNTDSFSHSDNENSYNLSDSDSNKDEDNQPPESNKISNKSPKSVLSSARRIGKVDDTNELFQDQNSSSPSKLSEIEIKKPKDKNQSPQKSINKFDEYKKLADEKYKKEFDFDLSSINEGDSVHLAATSNLHRIDFGINSSDDESGFSQLPPNLNFQLNLNLDDSDNTTAEKKASKKYSAYEDNGIKKISQTTTKYGQEKHTSDSDKDEESTGIKIINKSQTKYGQKKGNKILEIFKTAKRLISKKDSHNSEEEEEEEGNPKRIPKDQSSDGYYEVQNSRLTFPDKKKKKKPTSSEDDEY